MAKGTDYSNSAERLTNPESVRLLLLTRLGLNSRIGELQKELGMRNVDLMTQIKDLVTELAVNETEIKNTVLTDGVYQDVDAGLYALRQKRISYTYDPVNFRKEYPEFAPAVIREMVDTTKLGGLIKGGLLNMAALERDLVAVSSETFAFILKITDSVSKVEAPEIKKD